MKNKYIMLCIDKITDVYWYTYHKQRELRSGIKWFIQRLFRGHSDLDIWNLDKRLAEIIAKHIELFIKAKRTGYLPAEAYADEVPQSFKDIYDNDENKWGPAYWEYILRTMLTSFELIRDEFEFDIPYTSDGKLRMDILNDRNDQIKKGLNYFSKHFQHLWD